MKQQTTTTALYCRLSKDDLINGDSMSIQNQKELLGNYAAQNGFPITEYYVDDGYSGTNFERPSFKRMISDIEDGRIGTVIVKDLSRLGREYLQTGYFTEMFFPQNDVRFIAINDNVDSSEGYNDFAPFKNLINEWYARDCSKKIKAVMRMKAARGDCMTGMPPYGYSKVPDDHTKLIPNERAEIVKMMYQMALEGKSCQQIATHLTHMGLPIPKAEYYQKIGKTDGNMPKHPDYWLKTTVKSILINPVYTGKTVAMRFTNRSFKDKTRIERPEDEWITVENTHEALVSQEDYDTVCKRLSLKSRGVTVNPDNIFRGLIICSDCGKVESYHRRNDRNSKGAYCCATYTRYGRKDCSPHYITIEQITGLVLEDIKRHAALAAEDSDKYVEMLTKAYDEKNDSRRSSRKAELTKMKKRVTELETLLQKIYEDKVFGVITEERFVAMSDNMEKELSELKGMISSTEKAMNDQEQNEKNAVQFAELVRKYTDITELDEDIVHMLIEKICIHEREIIDGKAQLKVDIYYRFIGMPSSEDSLVLQRKKGHKG